MTDALLSQVIALVARCAGAPADLAFDADTRLIDGGLSLDSLRVLELSVAVEEHFSITLAPADLERFATVGSLAELVRCRLP
ncbi:MAG: acyl carrier protein [Deltaproteobacteria bacterium]|nr:acyl carrier protein [Deltaproteobacteria bacterium]